MGLSSSTLTLANHTITKVLCNPVQEDCNGEKGDTQVVFTDRFFTGHAVANLFPRSTGRDLSAVLQVYFSTVLPIYRIQVELCRYQKHYLSESWSMAFLVSGIVGHPSYAKMLGRWMIPEPSWPLNVWVPCIKNATWPFCLSRGWKFYVFLFVNVVPAGNRKYINDLKRKNKIRK